MSKLDKDQVIAAFTEAYTAANGKAPKVEAKGGWYSVDGGKNIRLAELNEMISSLAANKKTAKPKETKAEAKPAAKKAETKPAAKKSAAKAPAKTAKKKAPKTAGFSVKTFWAEQVEAGSRSPR